MRGVLLVLLFSVVAFASGGPALADTDPGQAAFERGDFDQARARWLPAAKDGVPGAQFGLGRLLLARANVRGLEWIKKAAAAGYLPAEYHLGLMYLQATYVPRDAARGITWMKKATAHPAADEALYPVAAARAGYMLYLAYERGIGVGKNMTQAVRMLRASADAGYADAQMGLAQRLEKGEGVRRDLVEAHTYYVLAWKQGLKVLKSKTMAVRKRLAAADFERSRGQVRAWMEAKDAGTHGRAYGFRNRITRGERILSKAERVEREVLEMAMLSAILEDESCERVWLRERKIVRPLAPGGSSWVERWIMDYCGKRKAVRVDFSRSGEKDLRWKVNLLK